jgi:transposase
VGRKTDLVILEGNQASRDYINTLQHNLLGFNERKHGSSALFQHDNASIHASRMTKQWLEEQEIDVMVWPARSPDFNPIENLWSIVARKVYEDCRQFHTVTELKEMILKCWSEIPRKAIEKLIESMPRRCVAVIEKGGGKIDY